jgi:hypothetical protein
LDGLAINADQEPHFVKVPDIEDDFEIPEEDVIVKIKIFRRN